MPEIRFPAYRDYVSKRVEVNNAMMALLAGSRLAAHTLQLTSGAPLTLGQLFPAVPHIERFNLPNDEARHFLGNADSHLASVAIPYALATHEAFLTDQLDYIKNEGVALANNGKPIKAWNMHSVFFATAGTPEPASDLQIFHVLRQTRNCIIHNQGRSDEGLSDALSRMGETATESWSRLNGGDTPSDIIGPDGQLILTAKHIFTAFANTKALGRSINKALISALPLESWARLAMEDFASATTKTRNSSQWRRSASGYVRENYAAIGLSNAELEKAARSLGVWTGGAWR
ncbi:hypothetical protein [Arsenicicoccus sp. UBA7492]|uniref:hypothetical protein n=1 Tax=Arsenicicoccus sp. UBA7492 TaxID=1946057 RepID=UPI00257FC167|nr:hypothetical protein [Arsenicicoccus sp. UBA7492]